jgi:AcrR family transcriptional regulator
MSDHPSTAAPRRRLPTKAAAAARRRLPAKEARDRILSAAERKLAQVGPESLRLTELASELGISHPAILHHFGSREELVSAVVARAIARINERLAQALANRMERPGVLLDMIAEFYGAEGNARLIAWLVLSGLAPKLKARSGPRPLQRVIELAHAQRVQAHPGSNIEYDDTKFRSQLGALALLSDAIFGDMIRAGSGDTPGPASAREFRKRLAKLLADSG